MSKPREEKYQSILDGVEDVLIDFINSETPTSISGCSDFHFGGGRLPHRSLDVQLELNEFTRGAFKIKD